MRKLLLEFLIGDLSYWAKLNIIKRWSSALHLVNGNIEMILVMIKFAMSSWNCVPKKVLVSYMGSIISDPLYLNEQRSSKSWLSFTRTCIEIQSTKENPKSGIGTLLKFWLRFLQNLPKVKIIIFW